MKKWRFFGPVTLALLALEAGTVSGDPPFDDGVPRGTVAFFDPTMTSCPTGWTTADDVGGRMVVGVTGGAEVGVKVGSKLGDREDRVHAHSFTGMLQLPAKSISGADGSNDQGAGSGSYPASGASEPSTTGLPFEQLFVCEKQ